MELTHQSIINTLSNTLSLSITTFSQLTSNTLFQKYKNPNRPIHSAFKLFGQIQEKTQTELSSDEISRRPKKYRGNYRKYTYNQKRLAVERIQNGEDIKMISKDYHIPRRNLLRWSKNGCSRKEGGGRPTDHKMENLLYNKIKSQLLIGEKKIRQQAIKISQSSSFKASKGWYLKFCRRYKIKPNFQTPQQ